jgi:shikimate kinase
MKLIFIYGPPAVGKLTVAEKLSELTKVPVFHNHHSRDIVKDIYGDDLMQHYALVDKIRFDVMEYCTQNNTDLIFTYVYGGVEDDIKVRSFMDKVESNGGQILFVELSADANDLINRVDNDSRKRFKKLLDKKIMTELTQDMSRFTIPYVAALKINTSTTKPHESAEIIARKLDLI